MSLTEDAKRVIKISQAYAKENMNPVFGPAHLLKALIHKESRLQDLLKMLDKDIYYIEEWADVRMESAKKISALPDPISGDGMVEEIMNEADNIRLKFGKDSIEPLHILAALCTPGVGFTFDQLKTLPLQREELLQSLSETEELQSVLGKNAVATNGEKGKTTQLALLKYCIDKTLLSKEGKLDAIIGRDKEIRMMSEILCRRSKPNVLIVGEPGVGKSSLVDAFALAILQGKVPQHLYNARIFELDCGALIAGASYKGEVEDRLKSILAEVKQFEKAILFIDEIHVLVDKQGAGGGAVNMLKPELARGEITLIGATTMDEYRKFIEPDEALSRRFEQLIVDEPDTMVSYHMLKAIMHKFEKHHGLNVPDETIKETIRLAKRYIKDRRLPDAAIDLADRSMAALRLINDTGEQGLLEFRNQFDTWDEEDKNGIAHTNEDWQWMHLQMKNKLSPILWSYFQSEEDPVKMKEAAEVKQYILAALTSLQNAAITKHTVLEKSDVAAIVSYKTGIPIGKVQTQERERLLNMEGVLKQRVIGQDHGIKSISEAILESRSGLSKPGQPIGSFFFLGPTGTGKTELTKALASFLFQDESFMIRFDMSEFKEEHSAALLYGAPPGYVGYEEGGLLVNKIRQKPYSVVLFDEIEKAHSSVFDIFLQIMDEGKLHDKLGKEGDFSNAVIIFTSNIGSQYVVDAFNSGEVPSSNKLMEIMSQHFRPEFLGRLTEIVPFAPMTELMVQNILHVQLKSLYAALEKQNISLSISEKAGLLLSQMGFTPKYGARPLTGVIRSQLRRPLSRKIISGEINPGSKVTLDVNDQGEWVWDTIKEA
ncbi:MAG: ATP-dependent Clp protease ATP-binding subunit [Chitinophagaceae bacterium]|nr:ATP-dependent Clp protease ATP-binding subunit [Chitinophagaceae bacterium]